MHLLTEQCSSILLIIVGCSIKHNDVTEVNDVNTQSLQLEVAIKIELQSQLPANNHPLIARFTEQWFVTQRSSWRPTWACFVAGTTGWTGQAAVEDLNQTIVKSQRRQKTGGY